MRKTVVFAEDSKEALEIIARELGPSALILETRRSRPVVLGQRFIPPGPRPRPRPPR